ncbi:uncharacterized protein LOC119732077 [Patiria miniata]|uniref:Ig-like domain-containing protein n=1 Tax=Patiria miniata TaxID=46514 RepID=A0A914ACC9_PATMI|nr:uncharacterized protein LOC119732077 [Patiria miniata]
MGLPDQPGESRSNAWVAEHHRRLVTAHEMAKKSLKAATDGQKRAYNKKARNIPLLPGERVLVRNRDLRGRCKTSDRWESVPYVVVKQPHPDIPVYEVQCTKFAKYQYSGSWSSGFRTSGWLVTQPVPLPQARRKLPTPPRAATVEERERQPQSPRRRLPSPPIEAVAADVHNHPSEDLGVQPSEPKVPGQVIPPRPDSSVPKPVARRCSSLSTGDTFPGGSSQASSNATFQRGRRQTLPCECASQAQDVVYWSTGEGITTDTQIIGSRFSDGTTLQIQHGADYSIGSDASLTVNFLNDVQDTHRFWCHVFQSDGTLRNCDIDAQISDDLESASDALKASERSFYLRIDSQQILPCLSWTPGDTACEVKWSKRDNPDRQVLSYNLSTGVNSSPEFDLASDFGLVIQSVYDDHAGVYKCAVGDENQIDVEVQVIGDRFPLDGGSAKEGDSVTIKPRFSLQCPALSDISLTTKATLFWSFGANDTETTTVIGTLNLPDGPKKMYDLGKDCLDISMEGALLFNNCSQDDDVRYWCHVFPANDNLIRSYVDVLVEDSNGGFRSSDIIVIAVCVHLFVIVLLVIVVYFLIWKWRRRSSHSKEDKEKRGYKSLDKQESVPELDLKMLAKKIKAFVIRKFVRIPITPWVDRDDDCFASIDTVYRPLEMFANVSHGCSNVKYQLDSESGIFDDGIPGLASKHAIIQGRRGCGKTTFLHRLIYDWAMGRERALWESDQMVVLVPARLLIKAETIGEVVVECMIPKDGNISAKSINAHYTRDKSKLTILVDDCNDQHDIYAVMKVMTDNEFLCCQLVLTTRGEELAKAASQNYNMRHVTITGFTLSNAIAYINVVLDTAEERKQATPEHKASKSKAKPQSGSTADTNTRQNLPKAEESPTVSAAPETQESTATDTFPEKIEVPKTPTSKKKRNIHRYLEEDILQPDISCLPAVLAALCQMSIWTTGDAFKPDPTVANLFFNLVKCMFDRKKGLEVAVTEGNQHSLLTENQLNIVAELGRVAYSRLVSSCSNYADYSKEDFLSSSEEGEHALEVAIDVGLLRPLQVKSMVESTEQITEAVSSEVSEVEIRTGCPCCKRKQKQQNGTEQETMRQETELTPLTRRKDERACFVLEILEQLCVGVFLPQTTGKVKQWFEDITKIGYSEIIQRFPNVFQFAIQNDQFDKEALVGYCAKIVNMRKSQARPLHAVLQLQKFVELCLQLNFEGQCEGALNKKLKSIFSDGKVRLIGISSYKLRLLSYLLQHAKPKDKSKLNVKSFELLRIGQYDWSELQEYIEYFDLGKGESQREKKKKGEEKKKKTALKPQTEGSQPFTTGTKKARGEAPLKDIEKLSTDAVEVNSSIDQPLPDAEKQPKSLSDQTTIADPQNYMANSSVTITPQTDRSQCNVQLSADTRRSPDADIHQPSAIQLRAVDEQLLHPVIEENKCEYISPSTQPGPKVSDSPSEDDGNEGQSIDLSIDEDLAVPKKLRERIESCYQDMPQFPPDQSDISVLHTVQSFDLHELLESQAGDCYLSGAARDLARYLPRLEMLESLVLVGTILSSDAICDLAKSADHLPNLRKLDLRLNKQFDDRAFVAVTNLPLCECKQLTDLRLSLYKVTDKGFNEVQKEMKKDGEDSWGRLKTLYLLHGSSAETFLGFLSNSLKYFHFVKCFHLSAIHKTENIQNKILEEFEQITNIMTHLKDIDIGNIETLSTRLAPLKLHKKKKVPGILKKVGTTVTKLGKKKASGISESVEQ